MGPANGFVSTGHRPNRRRERPGSRARRSISRKSELQYDCDEGISVAYDNSLLLPSDRPRPSPLLRQSFDLSRQRWKAKQAEDKALAMDIDMNLAELAKLRSIHTLQQEQLRLFGGDEFDEDGLYRRGILYQSDLDSNSVSHEDPQPPSYILRPPRQRRSRSREPTQLSPLPLYLSFANLSDDVDLEQFLVSSKLEDDAHSPDIQDSTISLHISNHFNIPLSLPLSSPLALELDTEHADIEEFTPPELEFSPEPEDRLGDPVPPSLDPSSGGLNIFFDNNFIRNANPGKEGDWTFISSPSLDIQPTPTPDSPLITPSHDPETWILLSDDS